MHHISNSQDVSTQCLILFASSFSLRTASAIGHPLVCQESVRSVLELFFRFQSKQLVVHASSGSCLSFRSHWCHAYLVIQTLSSCKFQLQTRGENHVKDAVSSQHKSPKGSTCSRTTCLIVIDLINTFSSAIVNVVNLLKFTQFKPMKRQACSTSHIFAIRKKPTHVSVTSDLKHKQQHTQVFQILIVNKIVVK